MATTARRYVEIEVNASQALRALKAIENSGERSERSLQSLRNTARSLTNVFRGLVGYLGVREIVNLSDSAKSLNTSLTGVTGSLEATGAVFEDILALANDMGASVEDLTVAYTQLGVNVPTRAHEELAGALENTTLALVASGAEASTSSAVLLQLRQALAGGKLASDEFNSVLEGAPVLLRAWAAALGRANTPLKELRDEGAFTTESFFDLREEIGRNIREMTGLQEPPLTVAAAIRTVRNEIVAMFRESEAGGGAFEYLAGRIKDFAAVLRDSRQEISDVIRGLGGVIEIVGSVLGVFTQVGSAIPVMMRGATAAISDFSNSAQQDINGVGDRIRAVFLGDLPSTLSNTAALISSGWDEITSVLARGINRLVLVWEQLPLKMEELWLSIQLIFQNGVNAALEALNPFAGALEVLAGSPLQAVRDLGAGFEQAMDLTIDTSDTVAQLEDVREKQVELSQQSAAVAYQITLEDSARRAALDARILENNAAAAAIQVNAQTAEQRAQAIQQMNEMRAARAADTEEQEKAATATEKHTASIHDQLRAMQAMSGAATRGFRDLEQLSQAQREVTRAGSEAAAQTATAGYGPARGTDWSRSGLENYLGLTERQRELYRGAGSAPTDWSLGREGRARRDEALERGAEILAPQPLTMQVDQEEIVSQVQTALAEATAKPVKIKVQPEIEDALSEEADQNGYRS